MKILVVEDDIAIANVYSGLLTRRGYAVTVAHDGSEAFHIVHTQQFDLIVLDIMLPNMDGLAMLRRIRVQPKYQSLPILITTALSEAEIGPGAKAAGATEVLIKTEQSPEILVERVDHHLAAIASARQESSAPTGGANPAEPGSQTPAPTPAARLKDSDFRVPASAAPSLLKLKLAPEPEKPKPVRRPLPPPPPPPTAETASSISEPAASASSVTSPPATSSSAAPPPAATAQVQPEEPGAETPAASADARPKDADSEVSAPPAASPLKLKLAPEPEKPKPVRRPLPPPPTAQPALPASEPPASGPSVSEPPPSAPPASDTPASAPPATPSPATPPASPPAGSPPETSPPPTPPPPASPPTVTIKEKVEPKKEGGLFQRILTRLRKDSE